MIAVEVGVGLNACAGSAVFVAASKPLPIQAPLRSAERPVQRGPRSGSYCQSKEALARRWGILSNLASISAGPIWHPPRLVDQVLSIVRLFRSRVDDEDELVTDPDQLNSASLKASVFEPIPRGFRVSPSRESFADWNVHHAILLVVRHPRPHAEPTDSPWTLNAHGWNTDPLRRARSHRIVDGDAKRDVTKREAIALTITQGARNGNPKHIAALLKITGEGTPPPPKQQVQQSRVRGRAKYLQKNRGMGARSRARLPRQPTPGQSSSRKWSGRNASRASRDRLGGGGASRRPESRMPTATRQHIALINCRLR